MRFVFLTLLCGLLCMPLHSIEEIVFDFGGVLGGTSNELLAERFQQELDISYEEAFSLIKAMKEASKADISKKDFWQSYAERAGIELPENWLVRTKELKLQSIVKNPESYKLIQDLLQQGYKLAILSNTTPERASRIREIGCYDFFNPVVLSCEIGVKKPHSKAFEILLARSGTSAKNCLFIDDKKDNVQKAIKLGFEAILFQSVKQLRSELESRNILPPEPPSHE